MKTTAPIAVAACARLPSFAPSMERWAVIIALFAVQD
jgi:hypothetical protein